MSAEYAQVKRKFSDRTAFGPHGLHIPRAHTHELVYQLHFGSGVRPVTSGAAGAGPAERRGAQSQEEGQRFWPDSSLVRSALSEPSAWRGAARRPQEPTPHTVTLIRGYLGTSAGTSRKRNCKFCSTTAGASIGLSTPAIWPPRQAHVYLAHCWTVGISCLSHRRIS